MMPNNPILWLQTLTKSHLSHHYILKIEQKFMVFTSKPVSGLKNTLISNTNIRGKLSPQYLCEKIHQIDPITMVTKTAIEANNYYLNNQEILHQFIEQLSQ